MKKLTLTILLFFSYSAFAKESPLAKTSKEDKEAIITISLENDIFANDDNNYTNGFRLSYLSPEDKVPYWLDKTANLIPVLNTGGNKRIGFELGQSMFTPNNIRRNVPDPDDQPYAGWLYGSAILISDNDETLDTFQLTLGIVGPSSLATETQDTVHRWISYQRPMGWDYQLKDEPGVGLAYNRKWRESIYEINSLGLEFDLTPSVGASLGNVDTSANTGLMFRIGQDLPADYGPPLIRPGISGSDFFVPSDDFAWYMFTGLEGRAVGYNIFLDGNTYQDSPSVDKKPFVGGAQAGLSVIYKDTRVSYTHVLRTKQFEGQRDNDEFGAVTVSVRF